MPVATAPTSRPSFADRIVVPTTKLDDEMLRILIDHVSDLGDPQIDRFAARLRRSSR